MKKVLVLSPCPQFIVDTLAKAGDAWVCHGPEKEVSDWPTSDWVVSFGYKKIIPKWAIDLHSGNIINIHISLLPWNRGADPNFWSWFDDTPKGVSIHKVDNGIDTGEVLANYHCSGNFRDRGTLRTTYEDLIVAAAGLFARSWEKIRRGETCRVLPVVGDGSYHSVGEADKFMNMLPLGYDTPVGDVFDLGQLYRGK